MKQEAALLTYLLSVTSRTLAEQKNKKQDGKSQINKVTLSPLGLESRQREKKRLFYCKQETKILSHLKIKETSMDTNICLQLKKNVNGLLATL